MHQLEIQIIKIHIYFLHSFQICIFVQVNY